MTEHPEWVAVDWGTSNLRVWVMGPSGDVLQYRENPRGMGVLKPEAFAGVLGELLSGVERQDTALPVVICGMAGAREGWAEAGYCAVPGPPPGADQSIRVPATSPDLKVFILPGMCQQDPPDVMRGEETQAAGFLAMTPDFDGILCMPGTHCKWVRCAEGTVKSFKTTMTGEVFSLLRDHSVLHQALAGPAWDMASFDQAAETAAENPGQALTNLFSIRADRLLNAAQTGPAQLSGMLIGAEVAALHELWSRRPVALIGSERLADLYARVLTARGAEVQRIDAEAVTLRGLKAAYEQLRNRL
ncbi:2-dehydro-3-deoxygalactonokinase [uncultured Martelella sp.]|uniref:2-dehydro-3-deoxygalactonokinase n=1 Tax=uncultured Martelella sp. TaxID=392331 RepID=UPI0029C8A36D|nr:2-dehydro-3-deoxygalactonokinase [uncultured Martelella sp.]